MDTPWYEPSTEHGHRLRQLVSVDIQDRKDKAKWLIYKFPAISGFLSTINASYVDDHLGFFLVLTGESQPKNLKRPMALTKAPNALGVPLSFDLKVVMCLGNAIHRTADSPAG